MRSLGCSRTRETGTYRLATGIRQSLLDLVEGDKATRVLEEVQERDGFDVLLQPTRPRGPSARSSISNFSHFSEGARREHSHVVLEPPEAIRRCGRVDAFRLDKLSADLDKELQDLCLLGTSLLERVFGVGGRGRERNAMEEEDELL